MKFLFYIFIFLLYSISISAQIILKQANTIASEIYADAPYRMKKLDSLGALNGIPIYIVCHDADANNANNKIVEINIRIKNAKDTLFGNPLSFFSYSNTEFNKLFFLGSKDDATFNIQKFDTLSVVKSSSSTLDFIGETSIWIPPLTYLNITKRWWYFAFTIPPEKLIGYDDEVDVSVEFVLDYASDEKTFLRVYRETEDLPSINNWYRGDTHYHTFFTQNTAEYGHPLASTSFFAKQTGLQWLSTTDHSCDFDNYGLNPKSNWNELGSQIQQLNNIDSSFKFIRGIEMSVNNSNGNIVHGLVYPSESNVLSLPYIADAGGDLSGTAINIDMMLDSCSKYNAFCYAAHPFSEGDKLSVTIGGNVWNVNDANFPENGNNHPSIGSVICNDLGNPSDIYSNNTQKVFKDALVGGQLLNLYNTLTNADEFLNPWNAEYSSTTDNFSKLDSNNYMQYLYRYAQNLDAYLFSLKKGIHLKNTSNNTNWKWFQSSGSDAHASFNFSNTDYTFGYVGGITNNAIGRLSTLAYCPNGMGLNGENILKALRNGQTILSDGPIVTFTIENTDATNTIIIGSDTSINFSNYYLKYNLQTTTEFGNFTDLWITAISQDTIINYHLPSFHQGENTLKLDSLISSIFGQIPVNKYIALLLNAKTAKEHTQNPQVFGMNIEKHFCTTNPIWLKNDVATIIAKRNSDNINIFPNPFNSVINLNFVNDNTLKSIEIFDVTGNLQFSSYSFNSNNNSYIIDVSSLIKGVYLMRINLESETIIKRIVKM
ncbi:MAG: T9SS type A sorting domain-containing protein [Bacteroidota bacterium]